MHTYKILRWQSPSWISKNCCHFFTIGPILTKFDGNMANSIWRRPPSWITTSCCLFFIIRPMRTKFGGNVVHLIWNALYRQETQFHQKSRWRLPPSRIAKNVCNFFTFDLFSPNLVGMLQIRCWMQLLSRKWAQGFNSKMAAAAILNFEKMWMWPIHYYQTVSHQTCC